MYSDFEKAFDKVSHNRLIYKLKLYGFSKDIITWRNGPENESSIMGTNVPGNEWSLRYPPAPGDYYPDPES